MSAGDLVYVVGATLAALALCSVPSLAGLFRSGPRYRAATLRSLAAGWGVCALVGCWVALGFAAFDAGGRWLGLYREFTLVLMGASVPLLFLAVRAGNRSLAAARAADLARPA